jgi:hypothetical protein
MPSDCKLFNEMLGGLAALFSILFGISEWMGFTRPQGCGSITKLTCCKCLVVADKVVDIVSPRNSLDGPRPWRKSCDLPRIAEGT